MPLPENAQRLRIHIGESDRWNHSPLYEALVLKARELGLAGATVFRSPLGFGASSAVHSAKILQLSSDLPVVVEIVDSAENLDRFRPALDEMVHGGLITIEDVKVIFHGPHTDRSA